MRNTPLFEQLEFLAMLGIIISIFFPIRYVLPTWHANLLGYYSDFTAISIYLSFIIALVFIGIGIYKEAVEARTGQRFDKTLLYIFFGILSATILYFFTVNLELRVVSLYAIFKMACALLSGYFVYKSNTWLKYKDFFLWTFIGLAVIQSVIALTQFGLQHSLGLNLIGESPLAISTYGVAKVVSRGTTFIRGYGTLPHPNILAAILAIVSFLNLYLLNKTAHSPRGGILKISYFVIALGIFTTLSRGGIFSLGVGLAVYLLFHVKNILKWSYISKVVIIPITLVVCISLFLPWLLSRSTGNDSALTERGYLNSTGLEIFKDHWVIGTGPGTNLFHMEQYIKTTWDPWLIQPIHNFFLIIWSEWGIIGLFITFLVLYLFYSVIFKAIFPRETGPADREWLVTLATITIVVFSLFCFDHYFYTIWPTQLLLWMILGLVAKSSLSGTK